MNPPPLGGPWQLLLHIAVLLHPVPGMPGGASNFTPRCRGTVQFNPSRRLRLHTTCNIIVAAPPACLQHIKTSPSNCPPALIKQKPKTVLGGQFRNQSLFLRWYQVVTGHPLIGLWLIPSSPESWDQMGRYQAWPWHRFPPGGGCRECRSCQAHDPLIFICMALHHGAILG